MGLLASQEEVAGPSNGDGGATKGSALMGRGGSRCQPKTTTGDVHPGLTQRRASGFASGIERPIDLEVSKAGELYYLSQGTTGMVGKIGYVGN